MKRIAVCPGSFDPVTVGHLDIITRASKLFDQVIVLVSKNIMKNNACFSPQERKDMILCVTKDLPNVTVDISEGLLADYVKAAGATAIVKGLRAVSDFEYEFQMAGMNRQLMPDVETIFLTPSDQYQFVSGTFVREIAQLSPKDAARFVTPEVLEALIEACADKKE